MIVDYSTRPIRVTRENNEKLGKPFSLRMRLAMRGIGSHRMKIEKSSLEIFEKLSKFQQIKYGSVELRPKGVLVHFKDNLTHWVWVIPYYKLVLYQTEYDKHSFRGKFYQFQQIISQTNERSIF